MDIEAKSRILGIVPFRTKILPEGSEIPLEEHFNGDYPSDGWSIMLTVREFGVSVSDENHDGTVRKRVYIPREELRRKPLSSGIIIRTRYSPAI